METDYKKKIESLIEDLNLINEDKVMFPKENYGKFYVVYKNYKKPFAGGEEEVYNACLIYEEPRDQKKIVLWQARNYSGDSLSAENNFYKFAYSQLLIHLTCSEDVNNKTDFGTVINLSTRTLFKTGLETIKNQI